MRVDDDMMLHLKEMSEHLLTTDRPEVKADVDGKEIILTGSDARSFGCGMHTVIRALIESVEVNMVDG